MNSTYPKVPSCMEGAGGWGIKGKCCFYVAARINGKCTKVLRNLAVYLLSGQYEQGTVYPYLHMVSRSSLSQTVMKNNAIYRKMFGYSYRESVTLLQHSLGRPTWEELSEKRLTNFLRRCIVSPLNPVIHHFTRNWSGLRFLASLYFAVHRSFPLCSMTRVYVSYT